MTPRCLSRATIVGWLLQVITIALAFLLCRTRHQHRSFAAWAVAVLLSELIRWGIIVACPWIMVPGPFAGWRRAIFHLDQGLFLLEPIGLVAVAWIVFLARRPWAPLMAGVAS
jgi:hypothetical protein